MRRPSERLQTMTRTAQFFHRLLFLIFEPRDGGEIWSFAGRFAKTRPFGSIVKMNMGKKSRVQVEKR